MALWGLYLLLTVVEMLALKFIGGMSAFDAVNHAFTTMPSGGFSTRDASIAHYDSAAIEMIIIVFMFLAGVNFTLMWLMGTGDFKAAIKMRNSVPTSCTLERPCSSSPSRWCLSVSPSAMHCWIPCFTFFPSVRRRGMHPLIMQHGPVLHASSCCC